MCRSMEGGRMEADEVSGGLLGQPPGANINNWAIYGNIQQYRVLYN